MPVDDVLLDGETRMQKAVKVFQQGLRGIRTGTASAGLVEEIKVDYYGTSTPLLQIAQIAVPGPQLIVIKPYDPSSLEAIERAIQTSDLGMNPQNDGKVIRLQVPGLSEERREQLVGRVKSQAEDARVAIRNIRRDANRQLEKEEKQGLISEDELHRAKDAVQELTDQYEAEIDEMLTKKSADIMKV